MDQKSFITERTRQKGFALPSVLWFVLLLGTLAAGVSVLAKSETKLAVLQSDRVKAQAVADAGISIAISRLLTQNANKRWSESGSPYDVLYLDKKIRIHIYDELGKLDINNANPELVKRFFLAARVEAEEAGSLRDRLVDWRDENDLVHLNGAEIHDYDLSDLEAGPRNAPFETASEISQVLGLDATLYECIRNEITVHSGRTGINPYAAGPLALKASGQLEDASVSSKTHGQPQRVGSNAGKTLRIVATAERVSRSVTIRLTGDRDEPYWVLATGAVAEKTASCGSPSSRT